MLVQRVGLVALPVGQADAQRVAPLIGQPRHELVAQPVLARRAAEALRTQGGDSVASPAFPVGLESGVRSERGVLSDPPQKPSPVL